MFDFIEINNNAFIFNFEKIISIPIVILFFFALKGIGLLVTPNEKFKTISPVVGFGCIYLFILFFSILMPGHEINIYSYFFIIIGILSYVFKNNKLDFVNDLSKICILSPFIIFAAFTKEYSWDDYTHWLRFFDYLFINNHLPTAEEPYLEEHSRYVYGLSIIRYIPNLFLSELNINVCGLLNVMFLSLVFDWNKILFISKSKSKNFLECVSENSLILPLIFFILLCHNTRVIMNANADFVLVIFSVSTILIIIKESIFKENTDFKIYLSIFLILTALISVKQIAIILVGIIYISLILSIIMDKLIHQRKIIKPYKKFFIHVLILVGLFFIYGLWEIYTILEKFEPHFFKIGIPTVHFDGLFFVINSIVTQLIHRPYSFIAFLILCYLAIFKINKIPEISLLIKTSIFFNIGIFLFLILIYISIWNGYGALSFHRYIMPAGVLSFTLVYLLYLDQITKKISKTKLFKVSLSLLLVSSILIIFNSKKFVRPILTDTKKLEGFILSNYNKNDRIILIDEKNWKFGAMVLSFNLRGKIHMDISSNVDNYTGKAYGFIKKSQILDLLKQYDKIFILPKNPNYNAERHRDLRNNFEILYPKNYTNLKKDNIFMLLEKE